MMNSRHAVLDSLVDRFAGGKKTDFAKLLGITKQSLNTWYNNEYIDVQKVYNACPGVSAEWLLTGVGEMMLEERIPTITACDILIPVISEDLLFQGDWHNTKSYVIVRGVKRFSDFISDADASDLSRYIYSGSLLFCNYCDTPMMEKEHLYIIKTRASTLFVELLGFEGNYPNQLVKFTTRRSHQVDMKIDIPVQDILQVAEISGYTVDHFVEHVI